MINEENMQIWKWLTVGISTVSVVLLILTSLSNVVGYQTVQTSQQNLIEDRINQRELLFQTLVDIANNKEIQRIILKSQMSRGVFPTSEFPVVTKTHINQMYLFGLLLSRFISMERMQSMIHRYGLNDPEIQQEISDVIDKDILIKAEITQLQNSECDCETQKTTRLWPFPFICTILFTLFYSVLFFVVTLDYISDLIPVLTNFLYLVALLFFIPYYSSVIIAEKFNCYWIPYYPH